MHSIQRPATPSFIVIGLVAGVLGLAATSVAVAADTSDAQTSSQATGAAAMHKKAGTAGSNTMSSRMAPTQNTTGSGANPTANTPPQTGANTMSGGNDQMEPMKEGQSKMPRMAPTQNTKGSGSNPKANN
ncbi:hypothetical protein [Salinisphaera sp.]|uniref:hypothetical protein n=1 Tax=Salinisphaera sp. TaxID=1914330 RepID=UPI003C7D978A